MDKLKKAYATLGLAENASREEVEKAFDLHLRKSRSAPRNQSEDFEEKLRAYKLILQEKDQRIIEAASRERFGRWGRFSGLYEWLDHFFRMYKTPVIIGVICCIALLFGVTAFLNHQEERRRLAQLPPVDLSILFVGNFITEESGDGTERLTEMITAQFPDWNRLAVEVAYLPPQGEQLTRADIAYQQKALAIIATEKPDVYFVDQGTFDWMAKSGVFYNLDSEIESALDTKVANENVISSRTEEDTIDHAYGINITESPLLAEWPVVHEEVIATVRSDSENKDKAIQLIERYLPNK